MEAILLSVLKRQATCIQFNCKPIGKMYIESIEAGKHKLFVILICIKKERGGKNIENNIIKLKYSNYPIFSGMHDIKFILAFT